MGTRSIAVETKRVCNAAGLSAMKVVSLDPRVNRLPEISGIDSISRKAPLDQFGTYEVFVQPKEGKPFQHEGIVHAPNLELAFLLAKETLTRRFTCSSIFVTDTRNVFVSPTTENDQNVYDLIPPAGPARGNARPYEIFHLFKRGKQHVHAGQVAATSPQEAMWIGGQSLRAGKMIYNVWAAPTDTFRFTRDEERDLWLTLPEKKFRDAADYKAGDKLKTFLEKK